MKLIMSLLLLSSLSQVFAQEVLYSMAESHFCLAKKNKLLCYGDIKAKQVLITDFEDIKQMSSSAFATCLNDNGRLVCVYSPRSKANNVNLFQMENALLQNSITNVILSIEGYVYAYFENGESAKLSVLDGVKEFNFDYYLIGKGYGLNCRSHEFSPVVTCKFPATIGETSFTSLAKRENFFYLKDGTPCTWNDNFRKSRVFVECFFAREIIDVDFDLDVDFDTRVVVNGVRSRIYKIDQAYEVDEVQAGPGIFCAYSSSYQKAFCRPMSNSLAVAPSDPRFRLSAIFNLESNIKKIFMGPQFACYVKNKHLFCYDENGDLIDAIDKLNMLEQVSQD